MANTSLFDDYGTQQAKYDAGTASATDILAVLKRKRKADRWEKGLPPKDTKALVDNRQKRIQKDINVVLPNMLKTDLYKTDKGEQKYVEEFAADRGISPARLSEMAYLAQGGPTQEEKKQQIRSNVQKMKDSRYESQKAAQASRWQDKWDDMDKKKKLKEKILAQRAMSHKDKQAAATKTKPPTKTKAPTGTTDSTGPARYGYKGTNNPDKV